MKKTIIFLAMLLLLPLISSEVIINTQPDPIYNLEDVITVPTIVKSPKNIAGTFYMDLICEGRQENFYKNGVVLSAGEEKKIEASLVLTKSVIGNMKGICRVKAFLGSEYALTNDFKISDSITIEALFEKLEISPGETIALTGNAFKENGEAVNGFVEISVIENNATKLSQAGTVNNGDFAVSLSLPKDMKAGSYLVKLYVYEQDVDGIDTNNGFVNQNIMIKQVPTNLEIVFESQEVMPGTNLMVKAILRDQTGEKIPSLTFISIKNKNNKILEQVEIATDEFHEFSIPYDEPPSTWKVVAVSNKLTKESSFLITEKEDIKIEISNKTVTITNIGNVPYNKTAIIKIGNQSISIDVYLTVGASQKYILTAPDGIYQIEISAGSESASAAGIPLTGKAIDVKKAPGRAGSLLKYPFLWIFLALFVGLFVFIFVRNSAKQSFFGYIKNISKKKAVHETPVALTKNSLLNSRNKAEISLSIAGEKQDASIVALNIRNLKILQTKEGAVVETIQKIVSMAEDKKAATYEDSNSVVFILSPTLTKTFKNERTALEIAQIANEILSHHNKIFKQRLDFGISVNYGPIIAKYENHVFKFSSIDSTISAAKKIASIANEEVLLSGKINERLRTDAKTIKHQKSGIDVYSVKEIKNAAQHEKFLKNFTERFEKENKKE